MLRYLFPKRNPKKTEVIQYSDRIRWWHTCIVCGMITANEISYLILLRNDTDQFTVSMCTRCRKSISYNREIKIINRVIQSDHKIIYIAKC